jgi:probable F420-dependent oxidoreductase
MSVAIGYAPGAFGHGSQDPHILRRLVHVGDTYGYDSLWLSDRIVGQQFSLEPIVALAMVAAYSDRLKFGTSVLALPIRHPVVLAKQIATLDYLSRGRCFPAVGLGQDDPTEYEACGVPKSDRGQRTDEAIGLMRRLWQEDCVTHEGTFFTCHNVSITPKPFLQPSPPVWIGGRTAAAAKRVGRVGDGWLVSSVTPDEVRHGRDIVFATAAQHQRVIEDDHIGVLLSYYISSDGQKAVSKAAAFVTRQRPDVPFTAYSAVGTTAHIADRIQQYVDAGAAKFVVRPLCPGEEAMAQLEMMGQEIVPLFHQPPMRTTDQVARS